MKFWLWNILALLCWDRLLDQPFAILCKALIANRWRLKPHSKCFTCKTSPAHPACKVKGSFKKHRSFDSVKKCRVNRSRNAKWTSHYADKIYWNCERLERQSFLLGQVWLCLYASLLLLFLLYLLLLPHLCVFITHDLIVMAVLLAQFKANDHRFKILVYFK